MPLIHAIDRAQLLAQAFAIESVGDAQCLGVVRDRDVLIAAGSRLAHHRLQSSAPVARSGVDVEITADVAELEHPGQRALRCSLDFAAILSQLGLDVRKVEPREDVFLPLARDPLAASEDPVLVDLEPLLHRHPTDGDDVGLRSREIVERGTEALPGYGPQIHLEPGAEHDACTSRSQGHHLGHVLVICESFEDGPAIGA